MPSGQAAIPDQDITVLRDGLGSEIHIDPACGNTVTRFVTLTPDGPVDLLIPAVTRGPNGYRAGVPILFPFPSRVAGGRYTFAGQGRELDRNETGGRNHIHGFVRSRPWVVEDAGGSMTEGAWQRAAIQLDAFPEVMRQYPFPCRLTVTTRLEGGALIQEAIVQNTGATPLPMGFGLHPWFFASHAGSPRTAAELRVPAAAWWESVELLPTGNRIPLGAAATDRRLDLRTWRPLDTAAYDDVLTDVARRSDGWTVAAIRYPGGLSIRVEASPAFREWTVFAPGDPDAVCLEPGSGATNAVNLQARGIDAGLVVLQPDEQWSGTVRISAAQRLP